ncbi:MAG: hypothetical protein LBP68_07380 [Acidobacteriota bacterium]|nr:hypothetical protein [Acidobacteriota bacterium]
MSRQEYEAALAGAPEIVDDPDCGYDPNDEASIAGFFKDAVVSGNRQDLKKQLAARRRGSGRKTAKIAISIRNQAFHSRPPTRLA